MTGAQIIGTGSYLPERIVTNAELAQRIDTTDEWIVSRTGIRTRRIAAPGELTSEMAIHAARLALEMAETKPSEVGMIVVGTITPDMPMPSCAVFVQHGIGATNAFAFDIAAACAGSLYGLSIAAQYVRSGVVKRALVIGVEMLSSVTNWSDRNTCVLFADGAGAMVIAPCDDERRGIQTIHLHSDGALADLLTIRAGGTKFPITQELLDQNAHKVAMAGREVYRVAVTYLSSALQEAMDANRLKAADISRLVAHQANLRILQSVLEKHGIPLEKAWINIDRYGNNSSASIPISLDEAVRGGAIKKGDVVAMLALGAGICWGSAIVRW